MFRHFFHGKGLIVFGEAEEGIEQRHVYIDIVTHLPIVASRSSWTTSDMLYSIILGEPLS